jgi:Mg2+-importing ATPase
VDEEYLAKPRKWNIRSIRNFMVYIGPISSLFDYATFFLMLYFFGCAAYGAAGSSPDQKAGLEKLFHTGWFVESLLTQTLIVHIIRTQRIPFLQSRASKTLGLTTLAIMAAGIGLPYSQLGRFLGFVPLPPIYFAWLAGFLIAYSVIAHHVKMWFGRRFGMD